MRRTVVVDDQLFEEARRILGTKGVRDTIEAGLRETVRRRRLEENMTSTLAAVAASLAGSAGAG